MPPGLRLDGSATIPVRIANYDGATPITSSGHSDTSLKNILIAAFQAIPSQSAGTATVAAIVAALKTLP